MAESEKPNSPSGLPELSVEKRMLLAFALVGVVLLLSQFLLAPPAKKAGPTQKQPAVAEQAKPPDGEPPPPAKEQTVTAGQPAPNAVAAQSGASQTIETNVYKIVFHNPGRCFVAGSSNNTRTRPESRLNWSMCLRHPKTHYPFSYLVRVPKALGRSEPGVVCDDRYSGWSWHQPRITQTVGQSAHKSFRFARDSYLFEVVSEVNENNSGVPHMLAWRGGFGDRFAYAAAAGMKTLYFDVAGTNWWKTR